MSAGEKYITQSESPFKPGTESGSAKLHSGSTASTAYSVAEGESTEASGNCAHAEGFSTHAKGNCAHAEGCYTTANGEFTHVEGYATQTSNDYEHAQGGFNISNKKTNGTTAQNDAGSTRFSVGVGTGENTLRANALEIMRNGDTYIKGVGDFDGKNASAITSFTVQDVIEPIKLKVSYAEGSGIQIVQLNNVKIQGAGQKVLLYIESPADEDYMGIGRVSPVDFVEYSAFTDTYLPFNLIPGDYFFGIYDYDTVYVVGTIDNTSGGIYCDGPFFRTGGGNWHEEGYIVYGINGGWEFWYYDN